MNRVGPVSMYSAISVFGWCSSPVKHMVVYIHWGPEYKSQSIVILVMGSPKNGSPILKKNMLEPQLEPTATTVRVDFGISARAPCKLIGTSRNHTGYFRSITSEPFMHATSEESLRV